MELSLCDSAAKVHDGIGHRHNLVQQRRVADVAVDEVHASLRDPGEVLLVAGVGERVEHGHVHLGLVVDHPVDEVAPDETGSAGDDDPLRLKYLGHSSSLPVRVGS